MSNTERDKEINDALSSAGLFDWSKEVSYLLNSSSGIGYYRHDMTGCGLTVRAALTSDDVLWGTEGGYHSEIVARHHRQSLSQKFYRRFVRDLVTNPSMYENPLVFLLFRTLAIAECRFVRKYIPQNSHEERLTGHLMSEFVALLESSRSAFSRISRTLYGREVAFDFLYSDIAANKLERLSGGDFGVIFFVDLPDRERVIRVARFQAKKAVRSMEIELAQRNALLKNNQTGSPESSYYCVYAMGRETQRRPSPLVLTATKTLELAPEPEEPNKKTGKPQEVTSVGLSKLLEETVPLSVYLLFEFMNPYASVGYPAKSLRDAYRHLVPLAPNAPPDLPPLNRLLVIKLGGPDFDREFHFDQEDYRNLGEIVEPPPLED